jgi:predicted sulfurtransferase
MKKLNHYPVTEYNRFPVKYYFLTIAYEIIKIANLKKTRKVILDFGCGNKIFSKILIGKKILNYDINPYYSEIKNYKNKNIKTIFFTPQTYPILGF